MPSLRSLSRHHIMCMCVKLLQFCWTPCGPMDCNLPGFSVCGILQAKMLEWVAMPSSGDRPDPGIELTSPVASVQFCLDIRQGVGRQNHMITLSLAF